MRALQRKLGHPVMIEAGLLPAARGVARCAVGTVRALVAVVAGVAGDAGAGRMLVGIPRPVASSAARALHALRSARSRSRHGRTWPNARLRTCGTMRNWSSCCPGGHHRARDRKMQVSGRPFQRCPAWQDMQPARAWAPLSAKPVRAWLNRSPASTPKWCGRTGRSACCPRCGSLRAWQVAQSRVNPR